jgi:hypothetical protein
VLMLGAAHAWLTNRASNVSNTNSASVTRLRSVECVPRCPLLSARLLRSVDRSCTARAVEMGRTDDHINTNTRIGRLWCF